MDKIGRYLFRGKRIDSSKWVEGNLIAAFGRLYIFPNGFLFSTIFSYHKDYEVIPESVGQFTGLTDKNGVKIFECDVLKSDKGLIVFVGWNDLDGSWHCFDKSHKFRETWTLGHFTTDGIEVIGNIHDGEV